MSIKDELEINSERDAIIAKDIGECEKLLKEIDNDKRWSSFCNWLFIKLKLKFRLEQVKCLDGIYTSFDADEILVADIRKAIEARKSRLEKHASQFIIKL